jgi:hypothetical protein
MAKNPSTEVSALLGGSSGVTDQLTTIATQLAALQAINQSQVTAAKANAGPQPGGGSTAGAIGETVLDFLGLGSLISGLVGLFGGGGSSPTAAVTPYIQPLPINLQAGFSGSSAGGASGVDYGEGGAPRQTAGASTQQQITVQVQAMDSQSFLDRSNDIAAAVRKAMLETSALNDVIREV